MTTLLMTNTAQRVRELAAEEFQVSANEVQLTSGPEGIKGWDSTAHMRLMARIEEAFSVSLDIEEIVEMVTIQAIIDMINAKIGKS
jgi:acyl carrier protein